MKRDSICFTCDNCTPKLCEWVNKLEKVWEESRVLGGKNTRRHRITKCKHYKETEGN